VNLNKFQKDFTLNHVLQYYSWCFQTNTSCIASTATYRTGRA